MKTIKLPFEVKAPMLACGADMKGAFALAFGDKAYLFDGFGDLSDPDNLAKYEKAVKSACRKLKIMPKTIVCDMHPEYFSSKFAVSLLGDISFCHPERSRRRSEGSINRFFVPPKCGGTQNDGVMKVQHHHAHIASAIVDNSIKGDVIGVAFDGTGFGLDENIWGGEFFTGSLKGFKRAGHLDYVEMPGGEAAVREPWRMAVSYLRRAKATNLLEKPSKKKIDAIVGLIDKGINSPLTSSAGRLFDAAGSIILGKAKAEFEAELPIAIEKIAAEQCNDYYGAVKTPDIIKAVAKDILDGVEPPIVSARFHNTIARLILDMCRKIKVRSKIKKVVLSGGVFQNRFLTERATALLEKSGFEIFIHSDVSTNDSGIPIGQLALFRYAIPDTRYAGD